MQACKSQPPSEGAASDKPMAISGPDDLTVDAFQDQVDPRQKVRSVVVLTHLGCKGAREGESLRVELRPRIGHGFQKVGPV